VLRQLAVSLVALLATFAACTRVEVEPPPPPPLLGEGGGAGQPAGGAGSVVPSAGKGGDDDPISTGGDPGSLELGLWPTFALDPSRSRDVQAVSASVAALSAGSRTLPLYERWDALSGASGTPLGATWKRLDAMVEPYRDRSGTVTLCVGVVDRTEPAWPFGGELEGEAARVAMERTIDEAFARYGGVLTHLCFGYELDRYWEVTGTTERRQLLDFLKQSIAYASSHPSRSQRTAIGVALSLGAMTGASDVPLSELNLADELLGVYDPLAVTGELKEPKAISEELDTALETVAGLPGPRVPLALLEAGYPSDEAVGASESAQVDYFQALLGALGEQRDRLSFVGVFGLGDRAASECESEAVVFGDAAMTTKALRARARCAMGLRAGATKPAWEPVLAAIAAHR
jgi:hypothetical protein